MIKRIYFSFFIKHILICFFALCPSVTLAQTLPKDLKLPYLRENKTWQMPTSEKKYILLDFWASWCAPCAESLPFIDSLVNKYPLIDFLAVNVDSDLKSALKFKWAQNLKMKVVIDKDRQLMKLLKIESLPRFFIFNTKGELVYAHRGFKSESKKEIELKLMSLK